MMLLFLVFSLHGMGFNTSLSENVLPQMISNILNGEVNSAKNDNNNYIKKIRNKIPLGMEIELQKTPAYSASG